MPIDLRSDNVTHRQDLVRKGALRDATSRSMRQLVWRHRARVVCALSVLAVAALPSTRAHAQETRGEQLFREGRDALSRNELDLACSKFSESYKLEKALGPLLNHARCEENRGKLVSAQALWSEAAARTQPGTQQRIVADERLASLRKDVPRLVIQLDPSSPRDTRIELDGVQISLTAEPVLVDPGSHVVVARYGAFEDRQEVQATRGKSHEVSLRISTPKEAAKQAEPIDKGPTPGWIAGWVVGGAGLAGLAGFGITGGRLLQESAEWEENGCNTRLQTGECDEPTGLLIGNAVLLGAGLAGLGVGIILLATQDSSSADTAIVGGPGDVGLALRVRF